MVLVFLFCLIAFVAGRLSASLQGTDFPDFYCAARMLLEGHGHQLYDADIQRQCQARYTGRVGTLYIHPPFEAVIYLAVAWLPMRRAYLLWSLLNLTFLAVGLRRFTRDTLQPWDWGALLAVSFIFAPVLLCFVQGQDSVLLLLLVVLAFTAMRRERPFAAGCWLGLGLFKFQIALPIMLVLLLTQKRGARNGLAKGFSLIAVVSAGISAAISGWSVVTVYPRFLLHLHDQPFAGIAPQAMANLRGLTYFFFRNDRDLWFIAALVTLSAAAFVRTLMVWKRAGHSSSEGSAPAIRGEFDLAFANTVLFALLVSYHSNPHDLSLLLLPISLLLHYILMRTPRLSRAEKWLTVGLLGILFLPPVHLWGLRAGVYGLLSLPLLALFVIGTAPWLTTQGTSPGTATAIQG